MDRKDFIAKCGALCGTATVLGFMDSCQKQAPTTFTIDLSLPANAALHNVGGYVIQNNTIVMKTSSGYTALSLTCTHAGCTVNYLGAQGFQCPCHGGMYDANGNVVSGPPPSPLAKFTVSVSGNILTVTQ
jgi:Rieske Fe-S protein